MFFKLGHVFVWVWFFERGGDIALSYFGLCGLFLLLAWCFPLYPDAEDWLSAFTYSLIIICLTPDSAFNLEAGVRKPTSLSLRDAYQYLPLFLPKLFLTLL